MSSSTLSNPGSKPRESAAGLHAEPSDGGDPRVERAAPQAANAAAGDTLIRRNPDLDPGLYIVSTPIGNLRDITLRALDVLASVDAVYAEDTRVARKLLDAYGLAPKLRAYHDHNGAKMRPEILAALAEEARIALISDAGTPLVSDPGFKLVREAVAAGAHVAAIPGASAPMAALAASGLPTDRFLFAGFPPPKAGARASMLAGLAQVQATLVFFEGPSRLAASLEAMAKAFGPREAVLARELTKRFEEYVRGPLPELAARISEQGPPKGELVVLVGPPGASGGPTLQSLDDAILAALTETRPVKEIAAEIADKLGVKRREVYARILELKDNDDA